MSNLLLRTISGIGLIIVVSLALIWNEYSMLSLSLLIMVLGAIEVRIMFAIRESALFIFALSLSLAFLSFSFLWSSGKIATSSHSYMLAGLLTSIVLYYLLFRNTSVNRLGSTIFNIGWVAVSLAFFMGLGWISSPEKYQADHLVILIILIWINDIFAFLIGSFFGKHPMAPAISPKKTWEGFIGGIILTGGSALLVHRIHGSYDIAFWIVTAVVVSLGATAGDLFESKLKREAGVKDSGNLIPGHGGILDRFDSLFFSAPLYYVILTIWERI